GSAELPHWTDPPTGEVPRSLGGGTADDDFDSWSSLSGPRPRFRTDSRSDWSAGDFGEGELAHDDSTMIGALADDDPEQAWGPPSRQRRRAPRGPHHEELGGLEGPPGEGVGYDGGEADVGTRVVTGAIMAAIALAAFAAGRPVAAFLVTVIVAVCAFE